ncbi:MAG: TIGR03936 family radical SAM-associated protein, partial [Spirochaetia bacterium]|nr:TIGR03936 family radical SAM-associated protein [Spirochaetia bacterium]
LYEIGMSNQGLKILYDRVNRDGRFIADRVFLPWSDFSDALIQNKLPLYSLDHQLSVSSFDVLGINISHELSYTNLLYLLELSEIPRRWRDRGGEHPFVIAGGTAVSNPFPIMDFMDGVFIGDGEDGIMEIMAVIQEGKEQKRSRMEILQELQKIDGMFVPAFYEMREDEDVPVYTGGIVKKRTYKNKDFSGFRYQVLPNVAIIQDRAVIEVARGCGQGCRFCHAGFWKRPVRNSAVDDLVENAGRLLAMTGSDSIALHSLSIADYPFLEELVVKLANTYGPRGISLSLPSLRVQVKTIPVLLLTSSIRRSSVTFALEAGSELTRERIRKKTSEDNLHYLIREIFKRGWDLVKVYFMLGLPDPDQNEIQDIIDALNRLGDIAKESGQKKHINVTVSLFVPKPFTTFQWEKQADPEYFLNAIREIKSGLNSNRVHLKYPYPWMAYVEGLLSRSDSRAGEFIEKAYEKGARFDSWDDKFDRAIWEDVIREIPEVLKHAWMDQSRAGSRRFWEGVIDGFSEQKLLRDYEKFENITSENMNPPALQTLENREFPEELLKPVRIPQEKFTTAFYLTVEYSKSFPFNYISHLDIAEIWRKAMRRAGLPMTFSSGFNKHEKLHFTEPLPIYFSSESELFYAELYERIDPDEFKSKIAAQLPRGIGLKDLKLHLKLPTMHNRPIRYKIIFQNAESAQENFLKVKNAPDDIAFEKASRKKRHRSKGEVRSVVKKLQSALHEIQVENKTLFFTLEHPNTGAVGITDLITNYLGIPSERWNREISISRISYI